MRGKVGHLLLVALGAFALEARLAAQPASAPEPATSPGFPVLPGVWHLDGTDPTLPTADLEPLTALVGKAQVVGLGESIHTSGGYYEAKHRLFRFLVEKLGFRVIAFETPWLDGDTANAYVQTCQGDAGTATARFFGVWRSEELSALIGWMCDWNRSHRKPKDKLSVYAFDVQYQAPEDAQALIDFLSRVGDDPGAAPYDGLSRCAEVQSTFVGSSSVPADATPACEGAVQAVASHFQRDAAALTRRAGKTTFAWAKLRLAGLQAWLEEMIYYRSDINRAGTARDRGMATLFQGIRALRFPKAKVALWAHNAHIARDPTAFGFTNMGSFLAAELGGKYSVVGLVSHEANIDWRGVGCGPSSLPGPDSVEQILHDVGEETLLVDLRFPDAEDPLLVPGRIYELNRQRMVPAQAFDGLVFLDRSRKMAPLAWPSCL